MGRRIDRQVKRGIIYKRCSRCHEFLPESEYNLDNRASDKLQRYCKECNKQYCRQWQAK